MTEAGVTNLAKASLLFHSRAENQTHSAMLSDVLFYTTYVERLSPREGPGEGELQIEGFLLGSGQVVSRNCGERGTWVSMLVQWLACCRMSGMVLSPQASVSHLQDRGDINHLAKL